MYNTNQANIYILQTDFHKLSRAALTDSTLQKIDEELSLHVDLLMQQLKVPEPILKEIKKK